MVAIKHAVQQQACSVVAMQHPTQHVVQHAVQNDAFIHNLHVQIAALSEHMYALQKHNEHLHHENSCLRALVAENNLSPFVYNFGSQEQMPQSCLVDNGSESESEPEIIEVIDDDEVKVDLPPCLPTCEDIAISDSSVAGKTSIRVQWVIKLFSERMNRARGRPLVSPDFSVGKLVGLRLSVAPDPLNSKVSKDERSLQAFKQLVTTGPFDGCLTLKTQTAPESALEYYVFINHHIKGPFTNDFSEQCSATHDDFGVDWLQDKDENGSLVVGVEILLP